MRTCLFGSRSAFVLESNRRNFKKWARPPIRSPPGMPYSPPPDKWPASSGTGPLCRAMLKPSTFRWRAHLVFTPGRPPPWPGDIDLPTALGIGKFSAPVRFHRTHSRLSQNLRFGFTFRTFPMNLRFHFRAVSAERKYRLGLPF